MRTIDLRGWPREHQSPRETRKNSFIFHPQNIIFVFYKIIDSVLTLFIGFTE